jgi:uncharacterized protein YkwD
VKRVLVVAVLLGASAIAAPRYNEPAPPPPRSPLVTRLEQAILDGARRSPLAVDARLEGAAAEIARRVGASGPPPNDLVEQALWLHGLVEPPPHLVVVTTARDADATPLVAEVRQQLPAILATGRFRRLGVAAEPSGGELRVVVALQESYVELEPVPRALPAGGTAALVGKLRAPYARPEGFVTGPGGQVEKLPIAASGDRFAATFRCAAVGRHQVELTGEDRGGPAVLANFPVFCGVEPPTQIAATHVEAGGPVRTAADAEAALLQLLNADRARYQLPPLAIDPRLHRVARAHSEEMARRHVVSHVSPTTGSASDRLRTAGVDAQVVLENVARAYSPGEIERGWMESPGHRANILNGEVTALGIGVALGDEQDGVREIFATQVFTRPPQPLPPRAADELHRRLDAFRQESRLPPLAADAALDALAAETAAKIARGEKHDGDADPVSRALGSLSSRYRSVRSVVAVTGGIEQVVPSIASALSDKGATAAGVGVATGRRQSGSSAVFTVVVLGVGR